MTCTHFYRAGRALLFLLTGVCSALAAAAATNTIDVTYRATDFQLQPLAVRRVTQTPLAPFADYGGAILSAVPRGLVSDTNGSVTFSNTVPGYAYRVQFDTPYGSTVRTCGFPASLSGPINGADYLGDLKGQGFYYTRIGLAAGNGIQIATNGANAWLISAVAGLATNAPDIGPSATVVVSSNALLRTPSIKTGSIDTNFFSASAYNWIKSLQGGAGVTNNQYLPGVPTLGSFNLGSFGMGSLGISNSIFYGETPIDASYQILGAQKNHQPGVNVLYWGGPSWTANAMFLASAASANNGIEKTNSRFCEQFVDDQWNVVSGYQRRETNWINIFPWSSAYSTPGYSNGPAEMYRWGTNLDQFYSDRRSTTYIRGTNVNIANGAITAGTNGNVGVANALSAGGTLSAAVTSGGLSLANGNLLDIGLASPVAAYFGGGLSVVGDNDWGSVTNFSFPSATAFFGALKLNTGFGGTQPIMSPKTGTDVAFNGGVWATNFNGGGAGLSNASPALATNSATATDGQVLSKTGDKLKLITISAGGGDAYLGNNQTFTGWNRFTAPMTNSSITVTQMQGSAGNFKVDANDNVQASSYTNWGGGAYITPTGDMYGQSFTTPGAVSAASFSGAGTGLTGTAASLRAGSATTAYNLAALASVPFLSGGAFNAAGYTNQFVLTNSVYAYQYFNASNNVTISNLYPNGPLGTLMVRNTNASAALSVFFTGPGKLTGDLSYTANTNGLVVAAGKNAVVSWLMISGVETNWCNAVSQ